MSISSTGSKQTHIPTTQKNSQKTLKCLKVSLCIGTAITGVYAIRSAKKREYSKAAGLSAASLTMLGTQHLLPITKRAKRSTAFTNQPGEQNMGSCRMQGEANWVDVSGNSDPQTIEITNPEATQKTLPESAISTWNMTEHPTERTPTPTPRPQPKEETRSLFNLLSRWFSRN